MASCVLLFFGALLCLGTACAAAPLNLYVSVRGTDANNGLSPSQAFRTLSKARDTLRAMKRKNAFPANGAVVNVMGGTYDFSKGPFTLTQEDSGASDVARVTYRGLSTGLEPAVLSGGVAVPESAWKKYAPIPNGYVADLKALGLTNYGELESGGLGNCANNKLELYVHDQPLTLARYPNIDASTGQWQWENIVNVTNVETGFTYQGNRPSRWVNASDAWLHGYWKYGWADSYVKIERIEPAASTFHIDASTPPVYGFEKNARYYAVNLFEELDQEGEYWLDRKTGQLFAILEQAPTTAVVSVGEGIVKADGASYVTFEGLHMSYSRTFGFSGSSLAQFTIANCSFSNNGQLGAGAVGSNVTIANCVVDNSGCVGLSISGGDQENLIRGNNLVEGNTVSKYARWKRTYQAGIHWSGVGHVLRGNKLSHAPHVGILGGGNDCLFELNHLSHLCFEVTDSGAFYTGRSWIDRGNVVRKNKFEHIRTTERTYLGFPSVQAIYLDDEMSGYQVEDNEIVDAQTGILVGGGRRNTVVRNSFADCDLAVHFDNRGMTWQKAYCKSGGIFNQELDRVHYKVAPWSVAYPHLPGIYQDHPCVPVYNNVSNNTYCNLSSGKFISASHAQITSWYSKAEGNVQKC